MKSRGTPEELEEAKQWWAEQKIYKNIRQHLLLCGIIDLK